jgi:hypothetical protein
MVNLENFVNEILYALAAVIGTALATATITLILKIKEWVVGKIGETRYRNALEVARGLYTLLEDKYDELGIFKAGEQKKQEMQELLLQKFPKLTQVELDAINKTIWTSFNEVIIDSNIYEEIFEDAES